MLKISLGREEIATVVKGEKMKTGLDSLGVVVGEYVHTGVFTSFMPGVLIGSHCQVGPGTQVFENVGNNTMLYVKQEKVVRGREVS